MQRRWIVATVVQILIVGALFLFTSKSAKAGTGCEAWCGSCGYTFISCGSYCPNSSQCGGAATTDLRTLSGGGSNTTANTTPPTATYVDPNNGNTVAVAQPGTIATVGNPTSVTSTSTIGVVATAGPTPTPYPGTLGSCPTQNGYYCQCAPGFYCSNLGGYVGKSTIITSGGVNQVVQCYTNKTGTAISTQCNPIPGTAMVASGTTAGSPCPNNNSRGACGEAGGCPDGQQRLCSQGRLGICVISDACTAQRQTVTEGQSCSGLQRMSVGEPGNGWFVGCQGTLNCFCDPGITGSVRCYADNFNDSCAAPGLNLPQEPVVTTALAQTTTTTTTTTETPPFVCLSISKDIDSPKFGQSVRFTCGTVAAATRYEFQYKVGTETGPIAPLNAGSNITVPFAITKAGTYKAQCRPCTATECAPWQETF